VTTESATLQIKVSLEGIRPPIWRRLVVQGDATLAQLHDVLQVAMGWENCHLHCFRIGEARYGPTDHGGLDLGELDESKVRVAEVLTLNGRGIYEYDFGDSWEHHLLVEKTDVPIGQGGIATCTAGKRSCPPEDCGGVYGYMNLLESLADPAHEEHEELLGWVGGGFDAERFNNEAVNAVLKRIRLR
jgi:Plasmid pRiA4b ORF-3-like protein